MVNLNLKIDKDLEEYLVDKKYMAPIPMFGGMGFGGNRDFGGAHYKFLFPNGRGASVVKRYGTYGYEDDLWEIALMDRTFDNIEYEYDFEFDVIGFLSDRDLTRLLHKIMNYPKKKEA